jgi:hypothetical protein
VRYVTGTLVEPFKVSYRIVAHAKLQKTPFAASSSTSFFEIRNQIARVLGLHPDSVKLQYHVLKDGATPKQSDYPYPLTELAHYKSLIEMVQPIFVRPARSNARPTYVFVEDAADAVQAADAKKTKVRTIVIVTRLDILTRRTARNQKH